MPVSRSGWPLWRGVCGTVALRVRLVLLQVHCDDLVPAVCWPMTGPAMNSNGDSAWSPLASVPDVTPICSNSSGWLSQKERSTTVGARGGIPASAGNDLTACVSFHLLG
jgi:hypothetical protein